MPGKRVRRSFHLLTKPANESGLDTSDKEQSSAPRQRRRPQSGLSAEALSSLQEVAQKPQGTLSLKRPAPASKPELLRLATEDRRKRFDLTDPDRYVGSDGHMWIGKEDWSLLQHKFSTAETRKHLVNLLEKIVTRHDLPPPTREVKREEAIQAFKDLKELPELDLLHSSPVESRFRYSNTLGMLSVDVNNSGNLCLDYFFQDIRWTCKGGRAASASESWYDPKSRRVVFHHIIDADVPFVDRPRLRTHLGKRRFIPTASRPAVPKTVFDLYKPESVLDLSFGWGERLLGFEAAQSGTRFYGIDPDKRTLEAGKKMHSLCRQTRKKVELYCSPAEDFMYEILDEQVDMIWFAPPPFNNERYTEEDTQAYKRYTTVDSFINDFLEKTITKAWAALKEGGTFILDLGDLKAPERDAEGRATGGRYRFSDPLIRAIIDRLPGVQFRGTIGMGMNRSKMDNVHGRVRVDPLWVFTKGHCSLARKGLFGSKTVKKLDA